MSVAGKHAVVTGGTTGIGAAIARALHDAGALVSIVSRRAQARRASDEFFCADADVADAAAVAHAFDLCRARFGPVAILVNNAGIAESAPFLKTDESLWKRTIDTNLTGPYHCTFAVLPDMLQARWGRVINIASIAGFSAGPYISAYAASKHGIVGLTRALCAEYAGAGVTFNLVAPGYTDTELTERSARNIAERTPLSHAQAKQRLGELNAGKRLIAPQEVADTVLRLCSSDESGVECVLDGTA